MRQTARAFYTPYYCEENIWHLARRATTLGLAADAIIISNPTKTCALWSQRAAPSPGRAVVWDYHVVLLTHDGQLFDLDTLIGHPTTLTRWWQATFPFMAQVGEEFQPWFRVIDAAVYAAQLNSDRQHMFLDGHYQAPPPPWPRIGAPNEPPNLMRWIDVQAGPDEAPGAVLRGDALLQHVRR